MVTLTGCSRVTRLGEFSPTFWVIVFFGQFFKSTEVAKIFGHFFHRKSYVSILMKNGFGFILCDFFANSSGHPGAVLTPYVSSLVMIMIMGRLSSTRARGPCFNSPARIPEESTEGPEFTTATPALHVVG
jgi:hypothetical protein